MRQTNSFSNNTKNKKMNLSFSTKHTQRMSELVGKYNYKALIQILNGKVN